jgi:opacity protein-like surface antigen
VSTPGYLFGLQAGYNWQPPNSNWVFGVQAGADLMSSSGVNTCYAFSSFYIPARCHVQPEGIESLTGRVGYAFGPNGRILGYVDGGGAAIDEQIDATTDGIGAAATGQNLTQFGWTLGAGAEYALTRAWSIGFEYDYMRFGPFGVRGPASYFQTAPPNPASYVATTSFASHATQDVNVFKVALNYHFGGELPGDSSITTSFQPFMSATTETPWPSGWELEFGPRYWYSVGKFEKGRAPPSQVSQLTYANMETSSAELFGRIDSPWGVFLKGYAGIGGSSSGQMNDEDFNLGGTTPYSNTVSSTKGAVDYAVVDLGYDWLRSQNFKIGSFVGYFYDHEYMKAYGCTQIADPNSDCVPALPSSTLAVTETDSWQALRLGMSGDFMLTDRLKLSADVAYLPYVSFAGLDDHLLRSILFPETGHGQGVQMESIVSYDLTKNWSVGVGGRYSAAWADHGYDSFPGGSARAEYRTERYGAFLQASFKFD